MSDDKISGKTEPSPAPSLEDLEASEREAYMQMMGELAEAMHRSLHAPGRLRVVFEEWQSSYIELRAAKIAVLEGAL